MHLPFSILFATLLIASTAVAGDWPQILGPNRDGQAIGETIPAWTTPPAMRWRVSCGAGYAGVAVASGKVLLWHRQGDDEVLDCLAAEDGRRLWRASFPAVYRGGIDADRGPRSVPLIDGDQVYVYGAGGDLHAVTLAEGSTVWTRELRSEHDAEDGYFGAGSTAIVVGDLLIAAIGGRNGAGLVAVDTHDGKTRWTSVDEQASYASPVTMQFDGETRVVAVMGLKTVMIDPASGAIVRQFDFGKRGPTVNAATPLVDGTQLFVTASYGVGCRMLDMAAEPPKDLWMQRDTISSQYATPVRHGDWLYSINGREDMGDAGLLCARWSDGKIAWRRPNFGTAHLIAAGGRVLAQHTKGRLELFAAQSDEFLQLAVTDLPEGTYRSLPALANGVLYVRRTISATEGELLALDLNPEVSN
jgi:outer membrane protein assembly factor BamB